MYLQKYVSCLYVVYNGRTYAENTVVCKWLYLIHDREYVTALENSEKKDLYVKGKIYLKLVDHALGFAVQRKLFGVVRTIRSNI